MAAKKAAPKRSSPEKKAKASKPAKKPKRSEEKRWNLRLYIAGDSPRSRTALANLRSLCEARLKDQYQIEVIDLTKRPDLAKADQILAVPTLIRKIPEPMKRIIGDLSNADRALIALDLPAIIVNGGA
jgi:circadian clock protein KaiB